MTEAFKITLKILSISSLLHCSGCIYGPKTEHKNYLNALNGENYVTTADKQSNALLVPMAKRKERLTTVEGKIVLQDKVDFPTPLRFIQFHLKNKKGEILLKATTQNNGEFTFKTALPNDEYKLVIESNKYFGELGFEVKDYLIKDLILVAYPIK